MPHATLSIIRDEHAALAPELMLAIQRLEADPISGEGKVRELQHLLLGWALQTGPNGMQRLPGQL